MKEESFRAPPIKVRPDSKGRISLGKWAKGVSSFIVHPGVDGKLVLEPFSEVPAKERWLFDNREALTAVKQGLSEAAQGKVRSRGSFKKYLKTKE